MHTTWRRQKIQSIFELMMELKSHVLSSKEAVLKKYELSPAQMRILYLVGRQGQVTTSELAEHICQTNPAVTQIVDGLVKSGFLQRQPSTEDRRVVYLTFSVEGKAKFTEFMGEHLTLLETLMADLDDNELETLIRLQTKILNNSK
jgi:MarR family 2-MHQ and catechol resistance regulon transcriptional repressor